MLPYVWIPSTASWSTLLLLHSWMQKKRGKSFNYQSARLHIQDIVQKKYTVYSKYVGIILWNYQCSTFSKSNNTCLTVRSPTSDVWGVVIGASNVSCPSNSETSLTFLQQQTMRYSGISVTVSTQRSASEALTLSSEVPVLPSEAKIDSTPK